MPIAIEVGILLQICRLTGVPDLALRMHLIQARLMKLKQMTICFNKPCPAFEPAHDPSQPDDCNSAPSEEVEAHGSTEAHSSQRHEADIDAGNSGQSIPAGSHSVDDEEVEAIEPDIEDWEIQQGPPIIWTETDAEREEGVETGDSCEDGMWEEDDWQFEADLSFESPSAGSYMHLPLRPAAKASMRWWEEQADKPVYDYGNSCPQNWKTATVRQVALLLSEVVLNHNMRTAAFEELIKVIRFTCLPPDSLFPPSTYVTLKLMGAEPLETQMYHICSACGDHVWTPLPRAQWNAHKLDHCPNSGCNGIRFKSIGRGDSLEPVKVRCCSWTNDVTTHDVNPQLQGITGLSIHISCLLTWKYWAESDIYDNATQRLPIVVNMKLDVFTIYDNKA